MADKEHKGIVARWLEGKERDEDYARSTLPTSRTALFWDILKGRFGRLMLVNLLMLVTLLPLAAIIVWRSLSIASNGITGPYGAGLAFGYPVIPNIVGFAESTLLTSDLVFFSLMIPAAIIAALGISGGAYIIRNLIWTEGIFVANDFLRGIKRNFLNVMEAVIIFTLILLIARFTGNLADFYVARGLKYAGLMVASKVVGYIMVAFFLLVCMWMVALGISYNQGPWALFRNAVVMTIGTFPQTVLFAALATWPVFLALFTRGFVMIIAIIILILFGFSYLWLLWLDYCQWAFDKFVNPTIGVATGRGLYNKDKPASAPKAASEPQQQSAASKEYQRQIVAQGRSMLVSRPIKPIDDDVELYQLPESFSRDDLRKLKESKEFMEEDVKAYAEEHKNDPQYVEYNREFDERERALRADDEAKAKKKKSPRPPKMLNKR